MVLTADDALTQLVIFAGVMMGIVTWTSWQWLKAKNKFEEFDIQILFDKKFLGTAAGAAIMAFVVISGSFNSFLANTLSHNPATYIAAFMSAFGLGFAFNAGANQFVPGPVNPVQEKELDRKKAERMFKRGQGNTVGEF